MRANTSGPDPRRWAVLAVGMLAMTAGCTFQYGLAYLVPALRDEGMSLGTAGLVAAAPLAGLLSTLVLWGAVADRWGERWVIAGGSAGAGVALAVATQVRGAGALGVCLVVAGAAGASVHAASGRLILGWFAVHERGLAMGLRQTAQPMGVAVAALTLPSLASGGRAPALAFLSVSCVAAALLAAFVARDPARTVSGPGEAGGSPYRTSGLWRLHGASALLIVPQYTVTTFALVFLIDEHGWGPARAGRVLAAAQVCGAVARLAVGWWSDRMGSRLRPMRIVAWAVALAVAALAASAAGGSSVAVAALLVASVVVASPNGLAFTAVAERAGGAWAGRALGIHNTAQHAVAAATPPLMAGVIGAGGYPTAFAAAAVFPLVAVAVIPVRDERARRASGVVASSTAPRDPAPVATDTGRGRE